MATDTAAATLDSSAPQVEMPSAPSAAPVVPDGSASSVVLPDALPITRPEGSLRGLAGVPEPAKPPEAGQSEAPQSGEAASPQAGQQKPPEAPQATPKAEEDNEKIPTVGEMQARLAGDGFMIGGARFYMGEGESAVRAFARGIGEIIGRNQEGISPMDQEYIRFAFQTAEVAGISGDQLRVGLDGYYSQPDITYPDGSRSKGQEGLDAKTAGFLDGLGIPRVKPDDPQPIPEDSERRVLAQKERIRSLGRIIRDNREGAKLPAESILPEEDIRQAAGDIIREKAAFYEEGSKSAKILQRILEHCTTEDLASILANPGRLADQNGSFDVAQIIERRIKWNRDVAKRFGGWRPFWWEGLSESQRQKALAQEQFAALMANAEQLKQMKKDYKSAKGFLELLFKLFLFVGGSTFYQLVADEFGQVGEGRVPGQ